jgi:uncharacterized integral membrane protein
MRILVWLFRAFVFFTLFAFALNNQHDAVVHWFFGVQWRAPIVIIVLVAFAAGCAVGVVAMLPGWWRRRTARPAPRRQAQPGADASAAASAPAAPGTTTLPLDAPPRTLL